MFQCSAGDDADFALFPAWLQLNAGNGTLARLLVSFFSSKLTPSTSLADGEGPGTAFINTTGTGNSFQAVDITQNFGDGGANSNVRPVFGPSPRINLNLLSQNAMTIKLDTTTVCTGGSGATCLLKVVNSAGPFGSCFAVASPAQAAGTLHLTRYIPRYDN